MGGLSILKGMYKKSIMASQQRGRGRGGMKIFNNDREYNSQNNSQNEETPGPQYNNFSPRGEYQRDNNRGGYNNNRGGNYNNRGSGGYNNNRGGGYNNQGGGYNRSQQSSPLDITTPVNYLGNTDLLEILLARLQKDDEKKSGPSNGGGYNNNFNQGGGVQQSRSFDNNGRGRGRGGPSQFQNRGRANTTDSTNEYGFRSKDNFYDDDQAEEANDDKGTETTFEEEVNSS